MRKPIGARAEFAIGDRLFPEDDGDSGVFAACVSNSLGNVSGENDRAVSFQPCRIATRSSRLRLSRLDMFAHSECKQIETRKRFANPLKNALHFGRIEDVLMWSAACATKCGATTLVLLEYVCKRGFRSRCIEWLLQPKLRPMKEELYDFRTAPIRHWGPWFYQ